MLVTFQRRARCPNWKHFPLFWPSLSGHIDQQPHWSKWWCSHPLFHPCWPVAWSLMDNWSSIHGSLVGSFSGSATPRVIFPEASSSAGVCWWNCLGKTSLFLLRKAALMPAIVGEGSVFLSGWGWQGTHPGDVYWGAKDTGQDKSRDGDIQCQQQDQFGLLENPYKHHLPIQGWSFVCFSINNDSNTSHSHFLVKTLPS